jgi:hypothetical protein
VPRYRMACAPVPATRLRFRGFSDASSVTQTPPHDARVQRWASAQRCMRGSMALVLAAAGRSRQASRGAHASSGSTDDGHGATRSAQRPVRYALAYPTAARRGDGRRMRAAIRQSWRLSTGDGLSKPVLQSSTIAGSSNGPRPRRGRGAGNGSCGTRLPACRFAHAVRAQARSYPMIGHPTRSARGCHRVQTAVTIAPLTASG